MAPLRATSVAVSNFDQPDAFHVGVGKQSFGSFDFQEAGSFTTGSTAYNLDSVTFSIAARWGPSSGVGVASGFTVSLYRGMSALGPTALVATLTGNSAPTFGLYDYVPSFALTLDPVSTYWVVESAVTTPVDSGFSLHATHSMDEDLGALPGWSLGDQRWVTNNGGASWFVPSSTNLVEFSVNVSAPAVPDGGTTLAMAAIALITLAAMRGGAGRG